jgi:hypothetical protein
MPSKPVTVKKMYRAIQEGEERLRNFRSSRLLFLREYAGQYYDRDHATIGNEPLNMIFGAIATLVPNLVTNFPKTIVTSKFLMYRGYAELLGLGLDYLAKEMDLRSELRRWIVDSLFVMGIMKTGIATSDNLVSFSDDTRIDPGQPYAQVVDFDDYILDPAARRLEEASFVGHRVRVPRQMLLDSGLFKNDIVEQLQPAGQDPYQRREVETISQHELTPAQIVALQDLVDVREVWVPAAKAVVWLPAGQSVFEDYLRVEDYDGPDEGPYTYLALTPPLPNNPLPIAPVGIWYDLHVASNKMAKKIMEQAERQKDVTIYKPSAADDAQEVIDAGDGEAIGVMDPDGVKVVSYGGQQNSNESHLVQLSYWFNLASGNTDQLGGVKSNANTATQANILQGNQSIRVEDMRDLVYLGTKNIQRKLAWYLHTDPLIALPLIKRTPIPAQTVMSPMGPVIIPPKMIEEQQILSPDTRRGDFLDFNFEIEEKSMSRMDPAVRLQKALLFAAKVLPSAAQAAMICAQMQVPFSFSKFVIRMAKELDLEWMDEVFYDPNFQAQMLDMMNRGPKPDNQKPMQAPGGGMGAIMQNGQPANVPNLGGGANDTRMPMGGGGASEDTMSNAQPNQSVMTL